MRVSAPSRSPARNVFARACAISLSAARGEQYKSLHCDSRVQAERRAAAKLKKRRLPAGTSEYQAAWILDDDEGSETGSEAGAGSDEAMEEGAPAGVPLAEDDVDSLLNGGAEGTEADMDVSTGGIGGMAVAFLAFLGYEGPEAGFTGF